MLKEDLLPALQNEAERLGLRPLTDRAWQDWLDEKLIGSPKPRGRRRGSNPLQEYPHGTLERALTIIRLNGQGTKRRSLLRIQLWLRDYEVPEALLVEDLSDEFGRVLKRQFFRRPWVYDANSADAEIGRERQKRNLAPVDESIKLAKPSDDAITAIGSILFWSSGKVQPFDLLLKELASLMGVQADRLAEIFGPLKDSFASVSGLFGDPDEIEKSGLSQITQITKEDLINAKKFYKIAVGIFDLMSLFSPSFMSAIAPEKMIDADKVARSLRTSDWSVAVSSVGALMSLRRRMGGL